MFFNDMRIEKHRNPLNFAKFSETRGIAAANAAAIPFEDYRPKAAFFHANYVDGNTPTPAAGRLQD